MEYSIFMILLNHPCTIYLYTLSYTTLFRSVRSGAGRRLGCRQFPVRESLGFQELRHREAAGLLRVRAGLGYHARRSEEHTSELQSRENLVCRLLLEKKKILIIIQHYPLTPR